MSDNHGGQIVVAFASDDVLIYGTIAHEPEADLVPWSHHDLVPLGGSANQIVSLNRGPGG